MLRIGLFLLTNIAILFVFGIVMRVFGLEQWLYQTTGANYASMLIFCALFGFGGSFVSLLMSKTIAKRSMRVHMIENPNNPTEVWLMETVRRQATAAGIKMPEVGIFPDHAANAFATGPSRNNAMVAVSEGLLHRFDRDAVEAVLGHEVAHVANGDMVTMTLLQGILNTFVLFFARIVGQIVDRVVFKSESGHGIGFFIVTMIAQVIFGVLASVIVCWFSRFREFRADEGGAQLASKQSMIRALQSLRKDNEPVHMSDQLAAFGIRSAHVKALFSTHPPLEKRIAHLESLTV